jgi:ATP-dependent RNA circularization protein (DNA/RNA ligase family)
MHLPFSPGSTSDDKFMKSQTFAGFEGHELVYTEKLDGSNVCLTRKNVYSRSHAGAPGHVSFDRLKSFHSAVRHSIWDGLSVFGEWCFAVHSIEYTMLQHHLNIFGVREDETEEWWSWDDVVQYANHLNVPTVPVILRGAVKNKSEIKEIVEGIAGLSSVYGPVREGIVVRKADSFHHFQSSVGKWVRANHVQTDEHWTRKAVQKQPSINLV